MIEVISLCSYLLAVKSLGIDLYKTEYEACVQQYTVNHAQKRQKNDKPKTKYSSLAEKKINSVNNLLKALKKGKSDVPLRHSVVIRRLKLLSSVLGSNIAIKATRKSRKNMKYAVYADYKTLKFRLWVANASTSSKIGEVYRANGLYEYKNGVFKLFLTSKWQNMALIFTPKRDFYQIKFEKTQN